MAAQISESYLSRPFTLGQDAGRELIYDVIGTDDEVEVMSLAGSTSPQFYQGLVRESISGEPEGGGNWKAHVRYRVIQTSNEYTFDTGGGTQKITQSLGTVIYPGAYGNAPNFGGAIGVDGDKVEGVDITVPQYEFSETHYISDTLVTDAYKRILFVLTGQMNNNTFRSWQAGECLLLGVSGRLRGDMEAQWGITFRFACSPNVSGLAVGGITGISKRGWDYLWVRYDDFEDSFAYALVKRPVAAYVEQVYVLGDFSQLGIGT